MSSSPVTETSESEDSNQSHLDVGSERERVRDPDHGKSILQSFDSLRRNDQVCDFTVKADGQEIKVHKAMLTAASDYFRVMFMGNMKESNENVVDLKGITANSLQQIIDFIYTGELELSFHNLTEILNAASHLQVQGALKLCCDYLKSKLNFDNAEDILHIADVYSLTEITDHFDEQILAEFEIFCQSDTFLVSSADKLIKYISSDRLMTSSEYRLFELVSQWLQHDKVRCSTHAEEVFKHIRFSLMTHAQLQKVRDSPIIRNNMNITKYVVEGLKYGLEVTCGHPLINKRADLRTPTCSLIMIHQGSAFRPFKVEALNNSTGKCYKLFTNTSGSSDCRVAVVDNFIYICRIVDFGGGTLMNSLCRFDPRHLQVQELHPMKRLRLDSALVAVGKKLYVLGGASEYLSVLDSVECYDVSTNVWSDIEPLLVPTHSHAAAVANNKIYISGGTSSGDTRQLLSSFASFDVETRQWESHHSMFYARRLHDMVAVGNKIFVLGGILVPNEGQTPIECYNIETKQWSMLSNIFSGRSIGHYLALDENIYSIGREHYNAAEDEIWKYDIATDKWSKFAKASHHTNLSSAVCTQLQINFNDDMIKECEHTQFQLISGDNGS